MESTEGGNLGMGPSHSLSSLSAITNSAMQIPPNYQDLSSMANAQTGLNYQAFNYRQ